MGKERMPTTSEDRVVVLCLPERSVHFDPNPDLTISRSVRLAESWSEGTVGVVGWSTGGWDALRLAAGHPELPRLVLVATPFTDERAELPNLDAVRAKTLLLFGSRDELTGSRHGRAWQRALPDARLEMVPGGAHDLLVPMWHRVLSHLAPRRSG